ncbi:TOPRIM nucleotidyl transferase/hydrolase domain-containing protein [Streptomyces physcomitrii]|uniref:OLD protein-like TOPRIM domain-containing protein n=1 Tax=Streptomyces albus (strain ATCC 21838 / DSM 41398 / FERM P-419 / JCM 4703 / NBRC 107858) TaxID=1081613 RepID=A0A0B5EIQ6_STRA4|nr:hypothetical protein SLNWT_1772 [Streptomyces albus]AOU76463.1 hypothetical protein SLNHY_1772 [Streptomyces albus]AYN32249.1 hypothetical protein DUI70_1746 [Streptomyces albus]
MNEMRRFTEAVVRWAAGGAGSEPAAGEARELLPVTGVRTAVLVEGVSDRTAIETLAVRSGRNLAAEGVCLVPLGGATSIGRFLGHLGPQGLGLRLAGLCDAAEEPYFRRSLERAGLAAEGGPRSLAELGFQVCVADLEDELIRALGAEAVQQVVAYEGELRPFRTFQKQPAQRGRSVERQLRRFLGTHSGRKAQYARALVEHLDPARVPAPLARLLAAV